MDWSKPQTVNPVDLTFGGNLDILMPRMYEVPDEFRRHGGTKWNRIVTTWFFEGLNSESLVPKEGIDKNLALMHCAAIMRSFQPKHEDKEAAVAYLMSLWFK